MNNPQVSVGIVFNRSHLDGCQCPKTRPQQMASWVIVHFRCNHSAFNGYHRTPSDYSLIACLSCHRSWRTKAKYVLGLPILTDEERALWIRRQLEPEDVIR